MPAKVLFHPPQVEEALKAMVEQVYREFRRDAPFFIVGIQSGGISVARRLVAELEKLGIEEIHFGSVDTTLYRDDIHQLLPAKGLLPMELPESLEDAAILLVDDVIFTGRSARAAMDALFCLGRPQKIRLAVLVDRGHRELPIQPDYRGFVVETAYDDEVEVVWEGVSGRVVVVKGLSQTESKEGN